VAPQLLWAVEQPYRRWCQCQSAWPLLAALQQVQGRRLLLLQLLQPRL
jgi:hypothetical protein